MMEVIVVQHSHHKKVVAHFHQRTGKTHCINRCTLSARARTHTQASTHARTHKCTHHTRMHINTHMQTQAYTPACAHAHTHILTRTHTQTSAHTHAHTHTHAGTHTKHTSFTAHFITLLWPFLSRKQMLRTKPRRPQQCQKERALTQRGGHWTPQWGHGYELLPSPWQW